MDFEQINNWRNTIFDNYLIIKCGWYFIAESVDFIKECNYIVQIKFVKQHLLRLRVILSRSQKDGGVKFVWMLIIGLVVINLICEISDILFDVTEHFRITWLHSGHILIFDSYSRLR